MIFGNNTKRGARDRFGREEEEKPCRCAMEESFVVKIGTAVRVAGGPLITWTFDYFSIAVCEKNDSESWNDVPPAIEVTPAQVFISFRRRKLCGFCEENLCSKTQIICSDHKSGEGGKGLLETSIGQQRAIKELLSNAKNNPSKVIEGLLDFVTDFMKCDPNPDCDEVSEMCNVGFRKI